MIRRLLERLLYVEEDPSDPSSYLNRRWRWGPYVDAFRWGACVGIGFYLVQWEGKRHKPRFLQGAYLQIRPLEWRFGQLHLYYDGPHCLYRFGPFWFTNELRWCLKCMPADGGAR